MLNQFSPHRHNPYFSRDHQPRRPPSRCQPALGSFHLDPMRGSLESRPTVAARLAASATLRRWRGLTLRGLEQPKSVSSLQRQLRSALNALETPPKRRKTIVDIDEDVRRLDRIIIELQSSVNSITRQLSNQNTIILGLRHDLASANKKIRELERR